MTILSADLKLFAAEYPVDTIYGGGRMTATVVQDGVENNLFPDIDAAARASGRVQMRKAYAAVVSANTDVLMGAGMSFVTPPTDSAVGVVAFAFGDQKTLRAAAQSKLESQPYSASSPAIVLAGVPGEPFQIQTAELLAVGTPIGKVFSDGSFDSYCHVVSGSGSPGNYIYVMSKALGFSSYSPQYFVKLQAHPTAPRCVAAVLTTATSTTSAVRVAAVEAQAVSNAATYPLAVEGINASGLRRTGGRVPIFRIGDAVVLRNGATTETALVIEVDYTGGLTFSAPLANSYPSGSKVSALINLGDVQASVGESFSQQTWTKVFSDSRIGNTISANYNRTAGSISTSNIGAATDRWAIVFTSATAFKLISEQRGQIATGDIGTAFSPLNPITNTPYFTITTAGWGTGWGIGNVLRFNTTGAFAPVWVARTVSPSPAGAVDGATLEFRGTVNA